MIPPHRSISPATIQFGIQFGFVEPGQYLSELGVLFSGLLHRLPPASVFWSVSWSRRGLLAALLVGLA
jgi:hypothetical protein